MRLVTMFSLIMLPLLSGAAAAQRHPHVLMISVDGMRPDYITKADEHHLKIPNLRRFVTEGTYADGVMGVIPTLTFPSHTTMVTGVWPAQHGIFANEMFDPTNERPEEWYWQASENKAETLWQAAKQGGLTTGSVSWPVSAGMKWIDWNVSEYAQSETVSSEKEVKNADQPAGLMGELNAGISEDMPAHSDERKTAWALGIIRKYKPNFMTVHLDEMDHNQHAHGPFSPEANAAAEVIDGEVAQLIQAELALDREATIVIVSDHGFVATDTAVNLPALFVQNGLIQLKNQQAKGKRPKIVSWEASIWETGGSAAVILRNPNDKATYDKVYEVLKKAQADPTLGIKSIVMHDEFVKEGANPGASFYVSFKPGFRCGAKYTGSLVTAEPGRGAHGYLPNLEPQVRSSFFVLGAHIGQHKDLGVVDMRQIAPTIAKQLNISLPDAKEPIIPIGR